LDNETKKLYEAMFLADSGEAASDWEGLEKTIRKILSRNHAEVVSLRKWDERRLAYEVQGKGRGTYILCYFRADGDGVGGIERDVQLSERIMRVLILRVGPGMAESGDKETGSEPAVASESAAGPVEEGKAKLKEKTENAGKKSN
jgi:small subunit ribosomal protein S6